MDRNSPSELPSDSKFFLPPFVRQFDRGSNAVVRADLAFSGWQDDKTPIYDLKVKWVGHSVESKDIFDKMFTCCQETCGLVECDGFCGKKVLADDMVQFGQCEHNICNECLKKATSYVCLYDGTPGCCNKDCVREEKERARPSATSPLKCINSPHSPAPHLVHLTVFSFYMEKKEVNRDLMCCEMKKSTPLKNVMEKLRNLAPSLPTSKLYYTTREPIDRKDLIPLAVVNPPQDTLETLCDGGNHLSVVVAGPGVRVF